MQYKTIVLELLEQRPALSSQLSRDRLLTAAVDQYARELKTGHEAWKEQLGKAKPNSGESQIASEALEIAVKELEDRLPTESPPDENGPLSLDQAMTFIRRHTPPA